MEHSRDPLLEALARQSVQEHSLRFPVRIDGRRIGYISLDLKILTQAVHVHAVRRDKGRMIRAAVVSQQAADNWQQGMLDAAVVASCTVIKNLRKTPNDVDALIQELVNDAIDPLLNGYRYCAGCGQRIRRSKLKTCGKPECRRLLRRGKDKVQSRKRSPEGARVSMRALRARRNRHEEAVLRPLVKALRPLNWRELPLVAVLDLKDERDIAHAVLKHKSSARIVKSLKSLGDPNVDEAVADVLRYRREMKQPAKKR